MLKLTTYQENIKEFLKNLDPNLEYTVICPSPVKADIFRDILLQAKLSQNVEVVTISNFVKSNMTQEDTDRMTSKSSLLLEFWTIWKSKVSTDYFEFRRVYDLFTEIRSFSCELDLLEELAPKLKEVESIGLTLFHHYLSTTKKIDEQASYSRINLSLVQKKIIFWGFDHVNANQIDMLKKIANVTDVYIPIAYYVLSNCKNVDWPLWLTTDEVESECLTKVKARSVNIPEARSSQYLKALNELKIKRYYYLNLDSALSPQSLGDGEFYFKTDLELFKDVVNLIFEELTHLELENLDEYLQTQQKISLKNKNILRFKVICQLRESFSTFKDLSAANETIILDDLYCLKEKLHLDLPRTSSLFLADNTDREILGSDYLYLADSVVGSAFYITKSMAKSFQSQNKLSPDIKSILQSYGPIQSKNISLNTMKFFIYNFAKSDGIFLLEDGAFNHLLEWDDIWEIIEFEKISLRPNSNVEYEIQIKSTLVDDFKYKASATSLQTYLDCPRKFYLSYVEKIDIFAKGELSLTPDFLGTLEHLIIETALKEIVLFDESKFNILVENILIKFLEEKMLNIGEINFKKYHGELVAHTSGVTKILLLIKAKPEYELFFEYDLSEISSKHRGRVDLLIKHKQKNEYALIDFKRSKSSIPSTKSFLSYEKIQLWYYISALSACGLSVLTFGFYNLSTPDESLIFSDSESFLEVFAVGTKINKISEVPLKVEEVTEVLTALEKEIVSDKLFAVAPANIDVCTYCVARSVCHKTGSKQEGSL